MNREILVAAILTGNVSEIKDALPVVTRLNHSHIEKAYLYICKHGMPKGSAYSSLPRLKPERLSIALQAFDKFFANHKNNRQKGESVFAGFSGEERTLFFQLYHFIKVYYSELIEPGIIHLGRKKQGGVIRYRAGRA